MMKLPMVSVAIATYEMSGRGRYFLRQALESIHIQDYSDVDVVISDDSKTTRSSPNVMIGMRN